MASGEHLLALVSDGNRRAGILTTRQHPPRGDVGIFQQFQRHEAIVLRGFGVIQDEAQLSEVTRAQEMRHVVHRFPRQERKGLGAGR